MAATSHSRILILDFGSQVTQLIARRVREAGVYWETVAGPSHERKRLPWSSPSLQMALGRRQPPPGILHHSDRGSQYASVHYQAVLRAHHFTISMSGTGNCFDNAALESFLGTLKAERKSAELSNAGSRVP